MIEALLVGIVLSVALCPLLALLCRRWWWTLIASLLLFAAAVPIAASWTARARSSHQEGLRSDERPIEVLADEYVSSGTCSSCHPHNYATWYGSYHRTMTQLATPEAVVGDFDNVRVKAYELALHLQRRGDGFWAGSAERSDAPAMPIVMTTGSHHYQLYWVSSGDGRRVHPLPLAFLIEERRWVPRGSLFLGPPTTTPNVLGDWNTGCIQCHATGARPRADMRNNVDTEVAEFGIACEACHGPGARHVHLNRDPRRRYRQHLGDEPDTSIVNPERLSAQRSSEVCGQCHGISWFRSDREVLHWRESGFRYRPGDSLTATRLMYRYGNRDHPRMRLLLQEAPHFLERRFWSDGMVRVSGREYNGLLETPCRQRGELSCLSCHTMHQSVDDPRPLEEWADDQLGLGMDGNRACLQCHDSYGRDLEPHTHHPASSAGSGCYNCHMPHTTYGLVKAIRSHQIDSPSVSNSLQTGRPNACNQCHLDRTLAWTADHLSAWYGIPKPELSEDESTIAASLLWLLRGDAGQRALMAWSMGWEPARQASGSEWMGPFLARLLVDPYEAVRLIAGRSLISLPGFGDLEYDFVAPPDARAAAGERALGIWRERPTAVAWRPRSDSVLIDSQGQLRRGELEHLMRQRDDRSLELRE